MAKALLGNGVEGSDEGLHAEVVYHSVYLDPIYLVLQGAAGECPIYEVTQGDAAGGEMAGHVAQEEEDLKK